MDAIALSTFAEPVAMPIPSSESSPTRGSPFGVLVAAVVKGQEPKAQSSADTAVDAAAPQVDSTADMSPPVIPEQWLGQTDSPALLPKGLILGLEKFQANEQDPVTPEPALPQSSELDDSALNEAVDVPPPQSDSAAPLVANEELISSKKQLLRGIAEANVPSRNPDALQLDRAAPSEPPRLVAPPATFEESRRPIQYPAGIGLSAPETKSGRASGDMKEPVTPRGLSESALPDRLTPAPPSRGSMTDETMAHDPNEPKTPQHSTPATSQRPQEPLPQFGASAQPNTPAPSPEGISAPLQVGNVSAAVDGSAEVPVKVALATRDTQAAQMQTLALHIAARSARGDSRFTIRLDPPELGRIEVNLSVTSHGHAQAVVAVEKPQTLDLLLRDAPALERALKDAGLELGSNLSFSLKEEGRPHLSRDERYPPADRTLELVAAEAANALSALNTSLLEQLYGLRTARLDITV